MMNMHLNALREEEEEEEEEQRMLTIEVKD